MPPKNYAKSRMDLARATSLMGFSSGRWLDTSQTGSDPKTELDKALFSRMQDQLKKKRAAAEESKPDGSKGATTAHAAAGPAKKDSFDEVRLLHEAYQFLMKKYRLGDQAGVRKKDLCDPASTTEAMASTDSSIAQGIDFSKFCDGFSSNRPSQTLLNPLKSVSGAGGDSLDLVNRD